MKLYPHQKAVLDCTKDFSSVAYYLDMGLGKTFVGSEKLLQIGNNINLVICQKSKVQDWVDHLQKYCSYVPEFTYDLTKKKQMIEFFEHINCTDESKEACYGVINYELAWRRKELLKIQNFTMLLDESSLIQNRKAKQTKFILKLQAANVILLSGTPSAGKYENLWTQMHLLGWNISENLYNKQYVNWKLIQVGQFTHKVVDKSDPYRNVERLKRKLRENGAVFMKTEDCFDLPEQTFIPIRVNSSSEYRRFVKDKYLPETETRPEMMGDTILTERLYKRQLCGAYSKEKLEAFKDLLESTEERLIVFYNFNEELERLKKIAEELQKPISEVNGQIKDLTAYDQEENSVTFIQYQAGAMGLNLQKANKIVYYSLTDKSELFEQSKKRIHRIGQNKPCFYYLMLVRNSVETQEVLPTLKIRKEYSDELFQEN